MSPDTEIRLRIRAAEAEAAHRLLQGRPAAPGDDELLDRVTIHLGAVLGTVRAKEHQ